MKLPNSPPIIPMFFIYREWCSSAATSRRKRVVSSKRQRKLTLGMPSFCGRWDTHYALAKAFYHQQQFEGALQQAQRALSQSHGSEPAIELLMAQAQTAVGKFEDSAETLRNFLRLHPG